MTKQDIPEQDNSGQGHTPGPWYHDDTKGPLLGRGRYARATIGVWAQARYDAALRLDDEEYDPEDEKWILGVWGVCGEEDIANARLIAAAPDMLEALREFCSRVDAGEIRSVRTYAKFKAIIAKAEGR